MTESVEQRGEPNLWLFVSDGESDAPEVRALLARGGRIVCATAGCTAELNNQQVASGQEWTTLTSGGDSCTCCDDLDLSQLSVTAVLLQASKHGVNAAQAGVSTEYL